MIDLRSLAKAALTFCSTSPLFSPAYSFLITTVSTFTPITEELEPKFMTVRYHVPSNNEAEEKCANKP
jgi:hypothetical protein